MKYKVNNLKKRKRELKILYKRCTKCNEILPLKQFGKNKKMLDGTENQCKKCRSKKYTHICKICGVEFINDKKKSIYCSRECRGLNDRKRIKYKCDYCGKECEQILSEYSKYKNHYCGSKCKTNHQSEIYFGEQHQSYSQIKYKCDYCGKECSMKKSHYENRKYHFCSVECMGEWRKGKFCRENSPRWNPNKTDEERIYKREYQEYNKWHDCVFKRDNYTCIISGERNDIVAHHLYSYNKYKELRTDINNGVTISKDLHKEFHSKYGYGNNTLEQFKEFYKEKTGKDFKIN